MPTTAILMCSWSGIMPPSHPGADLGQFPAPAWRRYRRRSGLGREVITLALGIVVGLFLLPLVIYVVGRVFLGDYVRDPTDVTTDGPHRAVDRLSAGLCTVSLAHWWCCSGLMCVPDLAHWP